MMASFDVVNYSLRPNKSIQRLLVFDGIRKLKSRLELTNMVYIGLGSIWFTDFVVAHKLLGIKDMISMESDEIGYRRAVFNKPFATVDVRRGHSSQLLADLFEDDKFRKCPWVVWLDYDSYFNEEMIADIRSTMERSPENTVLLVTFNGAEFNYGRPHERADRLRNLFGAVVPDDLIKSNCKGKKMQETLANLTMDFMKSIVAESSREGGFKPAFRIIYKDTIPMVTVGGFMPSKTKSELAKSVINAETWKGCPTEHIVAPLLTIREATTLQSLLPSASDLSREIVKDNGFDLQSEQIKAFQRYYKEYPLFAQIVS